MLCIFGEEDVYEILLVDASQVVFGFWITLVPSSLNALIYDIEPSFQRCFYIQRHLDESVNYHEIMERAFK